VAGKRPPGRRRTRSPRLLEPTLVIAASGRCGTGRARLSTSAQQHCEDRCHSDRSFFRQRQHLPSTRSLPPRSVADPSVHPSHNHDLAVLETMEAAAERSYVRPPHTLRRRCLPLTPYPEILCASARRSAHLSACVREGFHPTMRHSGTLACALYAPHACAFGHVEHRCHPFASTFASLTLLAALGRCSRPGLNLGRCSQPILNLGRSSRPGLNLGRSSRPGLNLGRSSRPGLTLVLDSIYGS